MTGDEKQLLENVLDGLDRLFDFESSAMDTHALIFATSKALFNTEYFAILNEAANKLENILRSDLEPRRERLEALEVTNDLRIVLSRALPLDLSTGANTKSQS